MSHYSDSTGRPHTAAQRSTGPEQDVTLLTKRVPFALLVICQIFAGLVH